MSSTVVVVEDDPDILDMLLELLELDGFAVQASDSPDVNRIAQMCPDPGIFLIDLMLPGMSGVELAGRLRRHFPSAPMIAMSASWLMLEMASASGHFIDTLSKPFNLHELIETIERYAAPVQPTLYA